MSTVVATGMNNVAPPSITGTKFGRNYLLTAATAFGSISIGLPFTVEFDVSRRNYSSSNTTRLKIYNLSEQHRNFLLHDQWVTAFSKTIAVTFSAGYGNSPTLPIVFKGTTQRAWSVREGVNWITYLDCFDGGSAYANGLTNRTFTTGQSMLEVYEALISDLSSFGITQGAVSPTFAEQTLNRGVSLSGNTIDILRELTNGNFFIDNQTANVLLPDEAVLNPLVINGASGLLGTPIKEQSWLEFSVLFEPRATLGSLITLDSSTFADVYNGQHRVAGVRHNGMISATVCGEAVTTLSVEAGVFSTVLPSVGL